MDMKSDEARARWKKYYYKKELPDDIDRMRHLLETYSKIPANEVDDHLLKIRDKAWAVHPYPCIGRWTFLSLRASHTRQYQEVLMRLRAPDSRDALLDVGSCVGQAVRQLVDDGVDGAQLFATDLHQAFIDLGYELFRDRDTLTATFAAGDLLAATASGGENDPALSVFEGRVTIVHAANFFHLFTWGQQVAVGRRLVSFLQPGITNALVVGRQVGSVKPGEVAPLGRTPRYWHDQESFQRLWDEIGTATGTAWRADVEILGDGPIPLPGFGENSRYLRWSVYQVVESSAPLVSEATGSSAPPVSLS